MNSFHFFFVNAVKTSRPFAVSVAHAYKFAFSTFTGFLPEEAGIVWKHVRESILIPVLKIAIIICLIMSVMLVTEKLAMGMVTLFVKVFRRTPEKIYKWEAIKEDEELGTSAYPMVLVQVPMFNEREVISITN